MVPSAVVQTTVGSGPLAIGLAIVAVVLAVGARTATADTSAARLGRRVQLVELIRAEQARTAALEARVADLAERLAQMQSSDPADDRTLATLQSDLDALAAPAGLTDVAGPGLRLTLTDSTASTSPSGDVNDLVIHEQDLQAVINALWAGGAEAMSVNGQRLLATTAIRCVGNTLLLNGHVYSPPYVVEALGDSVALQDALDRDPAVGRLRDNVQRFGVGLSVDGADELRIPGAPAAPPLQSARVPGDDSTGGPSEVSA